MYLVIFISKTTQKPLAILFSTYFFRNKTMVVQHYSGQKNWIIIALLAQNRGHFLRSLREVPIRRPKCRY